jgi:glycosyltransferase involved in cell wall biosynthesis
MKAKRDVLFLCQYFYPEYVSSATLPYDTAIALTNAGFTIDALCGYPKEYTLHGAVPKQEDVEGIHIKRLKYVQTKRAKFVGRLINYFSFTFAVLLRFMRLRKYNSIIVYSNPPVLPWVASWAKKLFKSKLVFVAYDLYPEIAVKTHSLKDGNIICKLMNHINKKVFACADRVIVLSSEMKDYVENHRQIKKSKVTVIPNWYKDEGPGNASTVSNLFHAQFAGRFVVSFMGNLGICQDLDTILDAIRLLRDDASVQFLFSGHGNKMQTLKESVQKENLTNVSVYSFLSGKDYADALQISDCALISLYEGITGLCVPSRTYSYMMQGLPLIVIMDESDIANDTIAGAGMQVRNGDAQGLVSAINDMKNNPLEHEKMRRKSREIYLEKYTMEIATDQYIMLMKSFGLEGGETGRIIK